MADELHSSIQHPEKKGFSALQVLGIVFGAMVLTALVTGFVIKMILFPPPFKPVVLNETEEQQLEAKLAVFEGFGSQPVEVPSEHDEDGRLLPEKYSEEGSSRAIDFTERELNALMAKNTDLADKLAIDLADDMVSIKLLIPLDPDFPFLGGKTFKIKAGAELAYREQRPVVKLKGVSLMGVPMPNAWLGGLKNIDLVQEFAMDEGFWARFAEGVDSISVVEGFLKIELKE